MVQETLYEFKLPDIGEGVHEGEIAKWLVKLGDHVQEDAPMVEVMTDKVTVVITAPVSGVVESLRFGEGQVAHVGDIIITINTAKASATASAPTPAPEAVTNTTNGKSQDTLAAPQPCSATNAPIAAAVAQTAATPVLASGSGSKVLAAPAVRKLARTMGLDLSQVQGSGPKGRVRKSDLETVALSSSPLPSLSSAPRTLALTGPSEERIPYKGMRRKIGDHLVHAKQTAPHFTYVEEADMTAIVALRDELDADAQAMGVQKLTYLPFIIKAVVEGLKRFPTLNSSLDEADSSIVLKRYYNIGVAVATEQGLVVPVIHHADQLSVVELAQQISALSQKARQNQLSLQEIQGGTFTLTSIGSIGGIFSAPIVNVPEVGIMGIQKIEKRPVVRDDEIVIRQMTYLSISCDHRVVDGAEAALFMKDVIGWLEHPNRLLLTR